MAIKYITTMIPETETIRWGANTVTTIRHGNDTVWQKLNSGSTNFGDHTYIAHVGTPQEADAGGTWVVDLGREAYVKSFYLGYRSEAPSYKLEARRTTSDSWVTLQNWTTLRAATTYQISNSNLFRYFRLSGSGASRTNWEPDAGGLYYWCEAYSFTVNYQYH